MKILNHIITIIILIAGFSTAQATDHTPSYAGQFYPGDSLGLYNMVDSMLVQGAGC